MLILNTYAENDNAYGMRNRAGMRQKE